MPGPVLCLFLSTPLLQSKSKICRSRVRHKRWRRSTEDQAIRDRRGLVLGAVGPAPAAAKNYHASCRVSSWVYPIRRFSARTLDFGIPPLDRAPRAGSLRVHLQRLWLCRASLVGLLLVSSNKL